MNQHWPPIIEYRESGLDPIAHRSLEYLVQVGSFFHRVSAMDFGKVGVVVAFLPHAYAASALRKAPTFHADIRCDNFRGGGSAPRLTMRQTVAAEQPNSAWTMGCRTLAESGSKSKFFSASGIVLESVRCAIGCASMS